MDNTRKGLIKHDYNSYLNMNKIFKSIIVIGIRPSFH